MDSGNLAKRISKATARSGKPVSPHLFRSCGATTVAIEAPEAIGIMPSVLTHEDPTTTAQYYNMARGITASRRMSQLIADKRRQFQE